MVMPNQSAQSDRSPTAAGVFATTHWSVVLTAGETGSQQAAEALEKLCRIYWYPLYAYVRRQGHGPHDAEDLTQGFFARLLEKHYLDQVHPERGKFRSFLLAALKHFLADESDKARAQKRGGGHKLLSFDTRIAEEDYCHEPVDQMSAEKIYEHRWATAVLEAAMVQLRAEVTAAGKAEQFEHLRVCVVGDTKPGDYEAVGSTLKMSSGAVAVAVHRLRRRFRDLVREEVAHTVAQPDEIDEEMRHLFAVLSQA
jgi:RNA polymerase sigma-70 factor (ECF subfamily)